MPTYPDKSASRPPSVLEARGLSAGYGQQPVVSEISLSVGEAEVVSIVGPNGAGKSTLLKAVMGLVDVMAGSVMLRGADVTGQTPDRLASRGVGYVPQLGDVFSDLTVLENLQMGGYLLPKRAIGARVNAVLDIFPALQDKTARAASKLSGGEQKMVGLARALMTEPTVVVLDEPTAGLAPELAAKILEQDVARLADQGVSIMIVEQRAAAALSISDWTYVLVAGRLSLEGASASLLARPDFGEVFLGRAASV